MCVGRAEMGAPAGGEPVGVYPMPCMDDEAPNGVDVDVPAPNGVDDDGSQAGVSEEISPGVGIGVLPPDISTQDVSTPCKDLRTLGLLSNTRG